MKLHGYCMTCRKIKLVNVRNPALARGVPMGTCDACLSNNKPTTMGVRK